MASKQDEEFRILFVGKTGCGKSATANTILGEEIFEESASASSCTTKCQVEKRNRFEREILLVDSPGLFDTSRSSEDIEHEISKFAFLSAPGPHVIIYVVSAQGRFTDEEVQTAKKIKHMFGNGIEDYLIVLITKTEMWKKQHMTATQYMLSIPEDIQKLLSKRVCQYRSIAFNNTLEGEAADEQVKKLFQMTDDVMKANSQKCYTDEYWKRAERQLRGRTQQIMLKEKETEEDAARLAARQEQSQGSWCQIL